MSEYFIGILSVGMASGVVLFLTPDNPKIKKYMEYLIGVCIILTILSPVTDMLQKMPTLLESITVSTNADTDSVNIESNTELLKAEIKDKTENGIKKDLKNRFSLEAEVCCIITYKKDDSAPMLSVIEIKPEKTGKFIESDIKKYLSGIYECDIEIKE